MLIELEKYRTKHVEFFYDFQNKIFSYKILEGVIDQSEFQLYVKGLMQIPKEYEVLTVIADHRANENTTPLEVQEYLAKTVTPVWENAGVKKYAQILAKEFYANLSGQQVIDDINAMPNKNFQTRFFESMSSAEKWAKEPL